jgi:hypothetical protein
MLGNSHIDRNVSSSFIVPFKFESNLDIWMFDGQVNVDFLNIWLKQMEVNFGFYRIQETR